MKISLYAAISMDGFIARKDHSIDWLSDIGGVTDFGYEEFYTSVDVICMGSSTFQQISAGSPWPYGDKPAWIYSRTSFSSSEQNVRVTSLSPENLAAQLQQEGKQHLWVMGGGEIHTMFLNADLVDELRLFVMPTALGEGIPLFHPKLTERQWYLAEAKAWPGEVAELHYCRKKHK